MISANSFRMFKIVVMSSLLSLGLITIIGSGGGSDDSGGSGNGTPQLGIINSVSAEGIVADVLGMSRMAFAGVSTGYLLQHPPVGGCSPAQNPINPIDMDTIRVSYDTCRSAKDTRDGSMVMSSNKITLPFKLTFGDAANSFRYSQSEITNEFYYLATDELLTLKGDMQIWDHANGWEYVMKNLTVYYNTCLVRIMDADSYTTYDYREFLFHGEIYSNLLPDMECRTTRRFVAATQSYPSDGVMLITALADGSNVFVIANADASTVTLKIDSDNNSLFDKEILTTWSNLKNTVDSSLNDLFDHFWKK